MRRALVAPSLLLVLACNSPSGFSGDIASVEVEPPLYAAIPGESGTLTATAFDAEGRVVPGVAFTWSSSSQAASVTGGHVSALDAGSAVVTASAGAVSGSAFVEVSECDDGGGPIRVVAQGWVCLRSIGLLVDDTVRVRLLDNDDEVSGVTWSSMQTDIATVNAIGLIAGVAVGTATIHGATGGATYGIEVAVDTAGTITFVPDEVTMAAGASSVLVIEPRVGGRIAPSTDLPLTMSDSSVIRDTYANSNRAETFLLVTGARAGETVLSMTYRNMTGSARVVVTP